MAFRPVESGVRAMYVVPTVRVKLPSVGTVTVSGMALVGAVVTDSESVPLELAHVVVSLEV